MRGRPCPHGDQFCPCNNDTLPCNYETIDGSLRDPCPRTGTRDCECAAKAPAPYATYERGWCPQHDDYTFFCGCGTAA